MQRVELKIYNKELFLPILWTGSNKETQKYSQIWSSKRENKKQESGLYLLKRSNQ